MYSYEIDNIMKNSNYYLDSSTYLQICSNSPQISEVKYDAFSNSFYITTKDGYRWNFKVKE